MSCGNVFDLLGILVLLHRGQQISFPTSWVSSSAIVGCVGFLIPRLSPFSSLFARFCVLTGTGNSSTTLCYCILNVEQNNCFFSGVKKRCGKFSSCLWNSDNLG